MEMNDSNDNPTWIQYRTPLQAELAVIPIVVNLFILGSNIAVLDTFRRRFRQLHNQHYFMVGLAVADLMTLIWASVSLTILLQGEIWLKPLHCNILGIEMTRTIETTTCLHMAMSIEKCIAITNPVAHRSFSMRNDSKAIILSVIAFSFIFPAVYSIALLSSDIIYFVFDPFTVACTIGSSMQILLSVGTVFMFLPLATQLVTHIIMYDRVRRMRGLNKKRNIRAIKTVVLTVGLYWLCWAPLVIQFVWIASGYKDPPGWFVFTCIQMLHLNGGASIIIYSVSLPEFKLRKAVQRKPTTNPAITVSSIATTVPIPQECNNNLEHQIGYLNLNSCESSFCEPM